MEPTKSLINPVIPDVNINITKEAFDTPDQTRAHIAIEYAPTTGKDKGPLEVYNLITRYDDLNQFLAQAPRVAREADKDADAQLKTNKPGFCSETKEQDLVMLGQERLEGLTVTKASEGWLSHSTFSILHPTLASSILAEAHGRDLGNIANIYEAEMKKKRDENCGPTHGTQQGHPAPRPTNLHPDVKVPLAPACIAVGDGASCTVVNFQANLPARFKSDAPDLLKK